MKKKILSLCLVAVIAVMAIAGASLAYLTDTDKADNVFAIGNVEIKLVEQQRNETGDALEAFEQNKTLYPIVGSAQGEKDGFGLPTAKNYIDKIIRVENLAGDAYVRTYVAIPTVLDNVGNASQNILHFNNGNKFVAEGGKTDGDALNADFANWGEETLVATNYSIEGVAYNIYSYTYNKVMTKDEITGSACIVGFYLDAGVDYDTENKEYTITRNGVTTPINYDFSQGVTIPVYAVGVQVEGFEDADTAIDTAFGADFNPWAK